MTVRLQGREVFLLLFSYFFLEGFFLSVASLTVANLAQLDNESRFIVRCQLGLTIWSGCSTSAGVQVITQTTQLSKYCQPQLASNPHCSEIWPAK